MLFDKITLRDLQNNNQGELKLYNEYFQFSKPVRINGTQVACFPNINLRDGYDVYDITLDKDVVIKKPYWTKFPDVFTIILRQDSIGGRLVTWEAEFLWENGIKPIITASPNAVDVVTVMVDATGNMIANIAQNYS